MTATAPPLCLVYLSWTPYGVENARRFVDSYRAHPSGTEHTLLAVFAGPEQDRAVFHDAFAQVDHEVLDLGLGMDLAHYRAAVERFPADAYCFVNTVSEVLADGWLGLMAEALASQDVGMVGASGSYESPNAVRPGPLRRMRPGFENFPNPHLRTNGFAMDRNLIGELDWPTRMTREETVALEGGTRSLTRQVQARGLKTLVVGRDGAYPPERWRQSRTFRVGEQENLLLGDNRTRHYLEGGRVARFGLTWLAWQFGRGAAQAGGPGSASASSSASAST
jgi:hypothetical protein